MTAVRIELRTPGKAMLIDAADEPFVMQHRWYFLGHRYAARRERIASNNWRFIFLHRELLSAPAGMEVDHINGDGLDNQRSNIRIATVAQNQWNSRKGRGITGVRG